eukprot:158187_1
MEDFWTTEIIPSSFSHSKDTELYPGEICLYERDGILLTDQSNNDNTMNEITQTLKKIRFNNWCTGPPQHKNKNSQKVKVFEQLLNMNNTSNTLTCSDRITYHSLQRYYSLKARLQNDDSNKLYRRETFYINNPILSRQQFIINKNLNDTFINFDLYKNDYCQTNAEYILSEQEKYNELTRNDTHNIILWCKFANFYDDIIHLNRDNLYNKLL